MTNLLKEKRLEKNMTLEQVGNLVGVGKSTVRKWENGMIENMGRDKIVALSKALNISPLDILGIDKDTSSSDISDIYNKLESSRQEKVYKFAEKQLEEQNSKITSLDDYRKRLDFPWKGFVSAGTGEFLDGEVNETISLYDDEIPTNADFALTVNGDSMKPMFKDHETIFVEETTELINGSIGIVIVNDEAYVKKVYHSTFGMTLVSLNDDYKDINVGKNDFIKIIGKVVI